MEINPEDYKEQVSHLDVGASIKIPHLGCTESNAMKVSEQVEGTLFHCFKCGTTAFSSSYNSPRERLRREAAYAETKRIQADVSYDLPADFSQTIPQKGLAWLGQGGWTIQMMRRYCIGWSQALNRVILPMRGSVCTIGYIARAVESWQKPKYLEKVPPDAMWESINPIDRDVESDAVCVICEDILSAGRCGEFIKSYSILGTSLSTTQLNTLSKFKTIYIWLDPDKAGLKGVKNMYRRLSLVCDVRVVRSGADPKCLTDEAIKEALCLK